MINVADILLKSILLFTACQVLQVILWRIKRPRLYPIWLFSVFIILPLMLFVLFCLARILLTGSLGFSLKTYLILFSIFFCHMGLSGVYAHYFPIIVVYSPSLEILRIIRTKMPEGATYKEIYDNFFKKQKVLEPRLNNLIGAGVIYEKDNKLSVSKRGSRIAMIGVLYRKILGLPMGKG